MYLNVTKIIYHLAIAIHRGVFQTGLTPGHNERVSGTLKLRDKVVKEAVCLT